MRCCADRSRVCVYVCGCVCVRVCVCVCGGGQTSLQHRTFGHRVENASRVEPYTGVCGGCPSWILGPHMGQAGVCVCVCGGAASRERWAIGSRGT